jgi:predicted DsbA family dithiol-disulfide isomerase
MDIHVIADFVCPWCYIGKRQLEQALAESPHVAAQIRWLPFQLNPDMPEEGMPAEAFFLQHFGQSQPREMQERVTATAESVGLTINFDKVAHIPNTLRAHRLARLAATTNAQNFIAESLFQANFTDGEDIGDVDVLCRIAVNAGFDADQVRAFLESDTGDSEVLQEEQMVRQMGVKGVPFMVLNRQVPVSGAAGVETFKTALDEAANAAPVDD